VVVIFTMNRWWSEVIRESIRDHAHTSPVRRGLRIGMGLFILSEVMFFAAFFGSFFKASLFPVGILDGVWVAKAGVWPPAGTHTFDPWDLPFMNTLILLLSGTTITWAHHALMHGDRKGLIQGLGTTIVLGISFTCLQALEYHHAPFHFKDGIYPSNFFMATGFHGFHVIIGTIFLITCLLRARKGQFTPENHLGFEFAAWYWHFVDVVWLFLFVWIYWWGSS
jgi:cytochrome c oxidase subunit 3